jgi:hypothetical protein
MRMPRRSHHRESLDRVDGLGQAALAKELLEGDDGRVGIRGYGLVLAGLSTGISRTIQLISEACRGDQ